MTERALTNFEQVLLGVIADEPSSGYDLKNVFTGTPAAVYAPSPGALYPALRRLDRRALLRGELTVSAAGRARRVWHATDAGLAVHRDWLREPVQPDTVGRDLGLHLMRFNLMEKQLSQTEVLAFLAGLADALEQFVKSVTEYLATAGPGIPRRHPLLALEHGIRVHQASLEWARSAAARLAGEHE